MSLSAKKNVYGTFSNDSEWVQVIYDFSVDGGATGDYDIIEAKDDIVVLDYYVDVQTACTSGGSMVMDVGVGDGGTEFQSDEAVANLSLDSLHGMDTAVPVRVSSGSKIVMGIEAAALTAGKMAFNFLIKKIA